jgi:hypothetical protein
MSRKIQARNLAVDRMTTPERKMIMNKLQRFTNICPDDAKQEEWYWDRNLVEEDLTCHAKRTDRPASKSKAKVRKIPNRSVRNMQEDDSVEDNPVY